jgi:3-methylfumaryl-CoA hydratase
LLKFTFIKEFVRIFSNMQKTILEVKTSSNEQCCPTMVRRVAAMLDLDTRSFSEGDILPKGWHFFMLAGETRKSELRSDGFPGLGVPIPDLGLPRLLLGGRTVSYNGDIIIGSQVEKTSFIKSIVEKTTASGPMAIVTLQHELRPVAASSPAIIETQTYILLSASSASKNSEKIHSPAIVSEHQKQITPDETILFQYSALGFNSHKIHLDRGYAQNIEGLPDLVVNGGLTTLLLTEFIRTHLKLEMTDIKVKHIAPLYCNRTMTLTTEKNENSWKLYVYDDYNNIAVEAEINVK